MKQTQKELIEKLLTIECQHRHYTDNIFCPAAKYLRAEWRSWAAVLRKEYPGALFPANSAGPVTGRICDA
jgi:hypothetical protein